MGALDISMDVQEGDAERLVVAAHVAHTISYELARREAEAENRAKDALYQEARAALEAERRTRAEAELANQQRALSEHRLRAIVDHLPALVYVVDDSDRFLLVNRLEVPSEPVWLDADPQRLQQVFSNLLTNASKFTEPKGRIDLAVEVGSDEVIVSVRDTGCGIAADALPHIFDLFAQVAPDGRGLGIGLAVVRGLVEQHSGRVEARSGGPGEGAEFIVHLSLAPQTVRQ